VALEKKLKRNRLYLFIGFILTALIGLFSYIGALEPYESKALEALYGSIPEGPPCRDIVIVEINADVFNRKDLARIAASLLKHGARSVGITVPVDEAPLSYGGVVLKRVFYPVIFNGIKLSEKRKGAFLAKELRRGPIPERIPEIAPAVGHLNYEAKGHLIKFPPIVRYDKRDYFSLSVVLAADYLNIEPSGVKIPVNDRTGAVSVYAGKKRFRRYSYEEIEKLNAADLRGGICLLGFSGIVETQACFLNAILKGDAIGFIPKGLSLLIILAIGLVPGFFLLRLNIVKFVFFGLVFLAFYLLMVILSVVFKHIYIDVIGPVMAFFILITAGAVNSYFKKKAITLGLPRIKGFDIGFTHRLSGGGAQKGFYEFIAQAGNRMGLLIGDVPARGKESEGYVRKIKDIFKSQASFDLGTNKTLAALNEPLVKENKKFFVGAAYLILESGGNLIKFSNAGGNPLVVFRYEEKAFEIFSQDDAMPLGIAKGMMFSEKLIQIKKKDVILLCNSGVTKTRNRQGRLFGIEKLKGFIRDNEDMSARKLTKTLLGRIKRFSKGVPMEEDMIFMAVKLSG